jgi:O-methyltransferase involved in polyketide biosynthesis
MSLHPISMARTDADAWDITRIHELSAPGSRIGVESFGAGFYDPDYLARRRDQLRRLREATGDDDNAADIENLWFIDERADVADWLTERAWQVTTIESADLIARYGCRHAEGDPEDAGPRTVFVDGQLTGGRRSGRSGMPSG